MASLTLRILEGQHSHRCFRASLPYARCKLSRGRGRKLGNTSASDSCHAEQAGRGAFYWPTSAQVELESATLADLLASALEVELVASDSDSGLDALVGLVRVELADLPIGEDVDRWFGCSLLECKHAAGKHEAHVSEESSMLPTPLSAATGPNCDAGSLVRLKLRVDGPMRTEWATLWKAGEVLAYTVDGALDCAAPVFQPLMGLLGRKDVQLGIAVATLGSASCLAPLAAIICLFAFPVVGPLLAIAAALVTVGLACASLVLVASRWGRPKLRHWANQHLVWLYCSSAWKHCVYDTCPRASLADMVLGSSLPRQRWVQLLVAVCLDIIGCSSFLLPGLGEFGDLLWGPAQALIVKNMFKDNISPYAHYLSAVEEILPFTDVIPSASILWIRAHAPTILGNYVMLW